MNTETLSRSILRGAYRLFLRTRWAFPSDVPEAFGRIADDGGGRIQQINVINLDRQADRWKDIQRELQYISSNSSARLIEITKRFPAIDARYYNDSPSKVDLITNYFLADQLFVEPHSLLTTDQLPSSQRIEMTVQEIAVALSHIALWKQIAASEKKYTLILEDDVYFRHKFAQTLDKAWTELFSYKGRSDAFDILYLSYKESENTAEKQEMSDLLFSPIRGLWQLSGYVLSNSGAKKLLRLLPVCGPVDLWMNHQFDKLNVFATRKSIIEQRLDLQSNNLYSILPILSKVGVLTQERPLLFKNKVTEKPVFAIGDKGTHLTSLAMALSMLGYRCCSDIAELPQREHKDLFDKKRSRIFDAYTNVGSLSGRRLLKLSKLYPKAKFIITVGSKEESNEIKHGSSEKEIQVGFKPGGNHSLRTIYLSLLKQSVDILVLPKKNQQKWDHLSSFLECEYPTSKYPILEDFAQRRFSVGNVEENRANNHGLRKLKFDISPWIVSPRKYWRGIRFAGIEILDWTNVSQTSIHENFDTFDRSLWKLLDDTFPSNLALFSQKNFSITDSNHAKLTLRKESSHVREYTSASISSRQDFLYGRFSTSLRPACVPGLITGIFLHRNSPRQEIDIEFLGRETTKILVNVFYNPGGEGANLEYGYRGTPILIDLGFDASKGFHKYSIEWTSTAIRWLVDDKLVHERADWDPTPIPHLPMRFYVNLWPSRSVELAGRLSNRKIPACCEINTIDIHGNLKY